MIPFPDKKYKVILADPPWSFKNYSKKGEDRNVNNHYDTMSLSDIKSLPVSTITDTDCVLFLWTTGPLLDKAFDVISDWGFTYKTLAFTWLKENMKSPGLFMGGGYWTRSNAEICLLATKGKPKRINADVMQAIVSPRREHSRKPDEIRDRIERLVDGPYIELFARTEIKTWDSWGIETSKFQSVPIFDEIFIK
jgi:N6-adenosine-specific RNA methylase IME4